MTCNPVYFVDRSATLPPMWYMQSGKRVLTKAEWACLAGPLELYLDRLFIDDDSDVGVTVFDRLTAEQKLLILAETCEALCLPEIRAPDRTALNEATIAALFELLRNTVLVEVDCDPDLGSQYREALRSAMADEREIKLPEVDSKDANEWNSLVEDFVGRVLSGNDYEFSDDHLDMPPPVGQRMDDIMDIRAEYFGAVPGDIHPSQVQSVLDRLRRLIRLAKA